MVQGILGNVSALAYICQNLVPESSDISGYLLAVGISHLVLGVHLGEALVFAHFYNGEVNAKFGSHIFYILCL